MFKTFLLLILFCFNLNAQENGTKNKIEKDTSYNFYSISAKMHKKFPDAKFILPNLPSNVKERKNIVYAKIGERKLHLDIFYPSDKGKISSGIVLIHGGGWSSGNRELLIPMAEKLAAENNTAN